MLVGMGSCLAAESVSGAFLLAPLRNGHPGRWSSPRGRRSRPDKRSVRLIGNLVIRIVRRNSDQFDIRFSSEPFVLLISDCLRVGSNLLAPTFLLSKGHTAFPDQRMALFLGQVSRRGKSSPVSFMSDRC